MPVLPRLCSAYEGGECSEAALEKQLQKVREGVCRQMVRAVSGV